MRPVSVRWQLGRWMVNTQITCIIPNSGRKRTYDNQGLTDDNHWLSS
jgi:hypothetical protein